MPSMTLYATDQNQGSSSYNSVTDIHVRKSGSTSSGGTETKNWDITDYNRRISA